MHTIFLGFFQWDISRRHSFVQMRRGAPASISKVMMVSLEILSTSCDDGLMTSQNYQPMAEEYDMGSMTSLNNRPMADEVDACLSNQSPSQDTNVNCTDTHFAASN